MPPSEVIPVANRRNLYKCSVNICGIGEFKLAALGAARDQEENRMLPVFQYYEPLPYGLQSA